MFFIVNKTKNHITLGDIGVSLGPKQAIDLDKIMKRSKSDESTALKAASRRGEIEIRIKDRPKVKSIPNTSPAPNTLSGARELGEMKKEIIGEMRELLKGQGGVSKEDLQKFIDAMPKITETVIYRQDVEKIREDEEVEIDEETLGEINKRAVNKMVENVESREVKYKQEKQKDDLMNNVSELEQLL